MYDGAFCPLRLGSNGNAAAAECVSLRSNRRLAYRAYLTTAHKNRLATPTLPPIYGWLEERTHASNCSPSIETVDSVESMWKRFWPTKEAKHPTSIIEGYARSTWKPWSLLGMSSALLLCSTSTCYLSFQETLAEIGCFLVFSIERAKILALGGKFM